MSGYELHVISNGKLSWTELAATAAQIYPHVTAIHIREKTKSLDEIFLGVQFLLETGIPAKSLYINGFPSIVTAAGLGGLQLQGSTPPLSTLREFCQGVQRTGVSIHSAEEAKQRELEGADFVMFGHIFATNSKEGIPARGLEPLRDVAAQVSIPIIAIGGMRPERVSSVLEAGASGIAVMSGIWEAEDPLAAVKAYAKELERKEVG
ncbi:thiamine phosphate synthase [Paenibacillus frigoriresistens]|uniref:thiamine phosphate synthase n=1 Tax=Paenibacillus alginolyticus TaxID=59839 RepID=UPI0015653E32|nr:thiamine phosphate synthase [Paenibacillus frigoriresistens]NRF90917.1 thiamine phosphate synthase [Paenibacillus frigoriresistens]